jgi:hypothetical protein
MNEQLRPPDLKACPPLEPLAPVAARNQNVVAFLRKVLEMAEKGEVSGVVVVMEHLDGTTSDRWATMGGLHPMKMIGALYLCLTRYTAHACQDQSE